MPTLYIDMDGVVADFDRAAQELVPGLEPDPTHRWPREVWQLIQARPNFYRNLPETAFAHQLMTLALGFIRLPHWRLRMLTAIPNGNDMPEAFHDKILWMQDHFPGIRVNFGPYSQDKWRHYQPGDILVDDRPSNCEEWRQQGGYAILVRSQDPEPAIQELKQILDDLVAEPRTGSAPQGFSDHTHNSQYPD